MRHEFKDHQPKNERVIALHTEIRKKFSNLADWIDGQVAPCREVEIAMMHVEEASMWANAAVARYQMELGG